VHQAGHCCPDEEPGQKDGAEDLADMKTHKQLLKGTINALEAAGV
jgi:hypothetical protein